MSGVDISASRAVYGSIKGQALREDIRITRLAHREMAEEGIALDDLLETIARGHNLDNYPHHTRGACCLTSGATKSGRPLQVVCMTARPTLIVIGVCGPKPKMGKAEAKDDCEMTCGITDCQGVSELRKVTHAVRHQDQVIAIKRVPADVCSVCGDALFAPDTLRRIEDMLRTRARPTRTAPLYEFA